jgi:hypothetical protein
MARLHNNSGPGPGPVRDALAAGASLTLGLVAAAALKWGFVVPAPVAQAAAVRPSGVAVRLRAPALRPVAARPASPAKAPPTPRKVPVQTPDAPVARAPSPVAPPPLIETAPAVALEQPAHAPAQAEPVLLPTLPALPLPEDLQDNPLPLLAGAPDPAAEPDALPAAPPDDYAPPAESYPEQPGGEVLVLGLLVDAAGAVLDTRILVPSHNALGDLSYAMVARRERISDLTPALQPGETRWLEVRVRFPKQTILP